MAWPALGKDEDWRAEDGETVVTRGSLHTGGASFSGPGSPPLGYIAEAA